MMRCFCNMQARLSEPATKTSLRINYAVKSPEVFPDRTKLYFRIDEMVTDRFDILDTLNYQTLGIEIMTTSQYVSIVNLKPNVLHH